MHKFVAGTVHRILLVALSTTALLTGCGGDGTGPGGDPSILAVEPATGTFYVGPDDSELLRGRLEQFGVARGRSDVTAELCRLSEGGKEPSEQTRNLRMNHGSLRTVSTVAALIRDWNEEPDHILVLVEEMSTGEGL